MKYTLPMRKLVFTLIINFLAPILLWSQQSCSPALDFESFSQTTVITASNQVLGWEMSAGYNGTLSSTGSGTLQQYFPNGLTNPDACNRQGCCPMPPNDITIICAPGGYVDPLIGACYPIFSVFGSQPGTSLGNSLNLQLQHGTRGRCFLRLNSSQADKGIQQASYTFSVTPSNSLLRLANAVVFTGGHDCCSGPSFRAQLFNVSQGVQINCPTLTAMANVPGCVAGQNERFSLDGYCTQNAQNTGYFRKWVVNAFDLTAYIGSTLRLDLMAFDCKEGDHSGNVYVDLDCGPLQLLANNVPVPMLTPTVAVNTCSFANLCIPDGLGLISWQGPGAHGSQSVPSFSNACISLYDVGTYTLIMQPVGSCGPITRIIELMMLPGPDLAGNTKPDICGKSSLSLSGVTGTCGDCNYMWQGPGVSGATGQSVTVSSTGIYTVIITNTVNTCQTGAIIQVENCVGIPQLENLLPLRVVPNPNSGSFALVTEGDEVFSAELYGSDGSCIHKQSGKEAVSWTGLLPGIYVIRVCTGDGVRHLRIVVE